MTGNQDDEFKSLISEIAKRAHEGSLVEQLQAFQKLDRYAKDMRKSHDFHGSDRWELLCIIGSTLLYRIRDGLFEHNVIDGLKLNPSLLELYRDIRDLNTKNSSIVAINETFRGLSDRRDDQWVDGYLDEIRVNDELFSEAQEWFYGEVTHPIVWYALIQTIRPPMVGRSIPEQVKHLFNDLRNMFGLEQYRYVAITARTILEYLLADRLGKLEDRNNVRQMDASKNPDLILSDMIREYCESIRKRKQSRLSNEERQKLEGIKNAMSTIRKLGNDAVHATIGTQSNSFSRSDARRVIENLLIVVEGLYSDRGF